MRASAKSSLIKLLFFIGALTTTVSYANDFGVNITNAELSLSGDHYVLTADIDFQLSERATDALKNGVPLFWTYQIKLKEQRDYLWNANLIEKNIRYRIQYHALLNMYRVRNESTGHISNFPTLGAAMELLSSVRDVALIKKDEIAKDSTYVGEMKINFERDALPLPLRPVAYVNPQWYLSSDWYTWTLKN